MVLVVAVVAGGTWAASEYWLWSPIPSQLVGKWVVEGGEQDGATFDFFRNGDMVGNINLSGRAGIIKARVRVQDNLLFSTTRNPNTDQDETRTQKIITLTERDLILEDDRGQQLKLHRADGG
jgi:uncharacterized protein (TIGR03066 family)